MKHLDFITAAFASTLLLSNILSTKITTVGPFTFDAGTILFPLAYIFGDILTEVYGFARARRVIWTGFLIVALSSLAIYIVGLLPPAADWPNQEAFMSVLGLTPRLVLASLIAYLIGEFSNSILLAKLKVKTKGKFLWLRTITSTLIGQGLDTIIFITIAFYGTLPNSVLIAIIVSNYIMKVIVEVFCTPATYAIVKKLKKSENLDHFDTNTKFNPFTIQS